MGDRQWFILYVLICLEVGIFLTLVPWSPVWERNYFLETYPRLRPLLLAPSLRGAVAGLGLANIYLGFSEVFTRRRLTAADDLMPNDRLFDADASVHRRSGGEKNTEAETLAASDETS